MRLVIPALALAALPNLCRAAPGEYRDDAGDAPPAEKRGRQVISVARPAYLERRYEEDWSTLAGVDLTRTGDPWDPLKYVPLAEDESAWASFGGSLRVRSETYQNFDFDPAEDDTYAVGRLRLHADVRLGPNLRVFAEGKSALSTDRDLPGGRRNLDVDTLDLQQAFADLRIPLGDENAATEDEPVPSFTLRAGRQELLFGRQRLVSASDWTNAARTFDGVLGVYRSGPLAVTGFYTRFVPVRKYDFNDPDAQTPFYGVYATGRLDALKAGADVYFLVRELDDLDEDRYTVGSRLNGKLGPTGLAYDVEAAYQFGHRADLDISAFMVAAELSYRFDETPMLPRVFVGFDYASGDSDPADGDLTAFEPLFPYGHIYLGFADVVGRQNVIDASTGVSLNPLENLNASAAVHFFWRAEDDDALYDPTGRVVRAWDGDSGSSHVGTELDLLLRYRFDRHLEGFLGYSRFFPGGFIEDTGPSRDLDFVYVQLEYTF